jgi:hypothetical protein
VRPSVFSIVFILCFAAHVQGGGDEGAGQVEPARSIPGGTAATPAAVDPDYEAALRDLETAWRSGDVQALAPRLGKRGVGLSLAGDDGADGWFSRNQALAILRRLLESRPTSRFRLTQLGGFPDIGGRLSGAVEWECSTVPGVLTRRILFVSLAREEDRWTVAEIRTADR